MGTLLESKEALKSRGLEVNLTAEEIDALIDNRVDSRKVSFRMLSTWRSPDE